MKILMHVAGLPFDNHTITNGESLGGSETAGYYMARELAAQGNEVVIFTTHPDPYNRAGEENPVDYRSIGPQTDACPMGLAFAEHAATVEYDVLIMQRQPTFLTLDYKVAQIYLWMHDVPTVDQLPAIDKVAYKITGIFAVSEYHKKLISRYMGGLNP